MSFLFHGNGSAALRSTGWWRWWWWCCCCCCWWWWWWCWCWCWWWRRPSLRLRRLWGLSTSMAAVMIRIYSSSPVGRWWNAGGPVTPTPSTNWPLNADPNWFAVCVINDWMNRSFSISHRGRPMAALRPLRQGGHFFFFFKYFYCPSFFLCSLTLFFSFWKEKKKGRFSRRWSDSQWPVAAPSRLLPLFFFFFGWNQKPTTTPRSSMERRRKGRSKKKKKNNSFSLSRRLSFIGPLPW